MPVHDLFHRGLPALCRAAAAPAALALALALAAVPARALDLEWSGFGNLGYAQSNRDYTWQRHITRAASST